MEFRKIEDLTDWNRKQAYEHFTHNVKNTITLTADIDVTNVVVQCKEKQLRFYASFIHLVSAAVNKFDEFKMGYDEQGNAGIWQNVSPSYTMFHDEDHSFHNLYTAYDPSFATFYKNAVGDIEANRDTAGIDWSNTPAIYFIFPAFLGCTIKILVCKCTMSAPIWSQLLLGENISLSMDDSCCHLPFKSVMRQLTAIIFHNFMQSFSSFPMIFVQCRACQKPSDRFLMAFDSRILNKLYVFQLNKPLN